MDFDFSDDQEQLRDAVRKWVDKGYTFERRRAAVAAGGFDRTAWGELAELGLTALTVPEAHGGLGQGAVDAMVAMEELGRGIVTEPLAQAFVTSAVIQACGSDGVKQQWLAKIASGEALVVQCGDCAEDMDDHHAENVARKYDVSRAEQDEFALQSQLKAEAAQKAGKFDEEIVPVTVKTRKGDVTVDTDEQPPKGNPDKIRTLRAAFAKEGTITAANASSISDGAAALVLSDLRTGDVSPAGCDLLQRRDAAHDSSCPPAGSSAR